MGRNVIRGKLHLQVIFGVPLCRRVNAVRFTHEPGAVECAFCIRRIVDPTYRTTRQQIADRRGR